MERGKRKGGQLNFSHVKVGDIVKRVLGEAPPGERLPYIPPTYMELPVVHVDEKFIYCGPPGSLPTSDPEFLENWWKFRRDNGAEVDEELEWGTKVNEKGEMWTGSRLVK